MSLLSDIKAEQEALRKGPRCRVCVLVEGLSTEDRQDLEAAFTDSSVFSTVISRALNKRGYDVKEDAVNRHRNGRCAG